MSPRKVTGKFAAVTAAFAGIALFSVAGAQAEETHAHHAHVAHHHHHHAAEVASEAAPVVVGGYYEPSEWGDYEVTPTYAGSLPYSAKDWSKP